MYFLGCISFIISIVVATAPILTPRQDVYNVPSTPAVATYQSHPDLDLWNDVHDFKYENNGTQGVTKTTLRSIVTGWQPRKIDHSEFSNIKILQENRLQIATHPDFAVPILIKTITSLVEISSLEQEVAIYRLLHGTGATPEFLGHATKNDQIIGFISEYIEEDPKVRQHSLKSCIDSIRVFHERGIAHGDAHDGNCLIRRDGTAVLIDFELSLETWSSVEFERDLDIMSRCIQDVSESS